MNILEAVESSLQSHMDKHAFDINVWVNNQHAEGALDKLLTSISKYEKAASEFEVLKKIKDQVSSEPPVEPVANNEH